MMTKKQLFTEIRDSYPLTDEHRAFIDHELELLSKKNASPRKNLAKQTQNAALHAEIVAAMEFDRPYTVSELINEVGVCNGLSNQKVAALMNRIDSAEIVRVSEKNKTYFKRIAA